MHRAGLVDPAARERQRRHGIDDPGQFHPLEMVVEEVVVAEIHAVAGRLGLVVLLEKLSAHGQESGRAPVGPEGVVAVILGHIVVGERAARRREGVVV